MDDKPVRWYQAVFQKTLWSVLATFGIFLVLGLFACIWRFLDLYEVSVKAQSVHAKIEMEQHQVWMREMEAQRAKMTSQELSSSVGQQTQQMPTDLGSTSAVSGPPGTTKPTP